MAKGKNRRKFLDGECKAVKVIFGIRAVLWILAFSLNVHWAYVSFDLYAKGIFDPHEYATILRPILYRDFLISIALIIVAFILRGISDRIKEVNKMK